MKLVVVLTAHATEIIHVGMTLGGDIAGPRPNI